jgi:hypothetical protein
VELDQPAFLLLVDVDQSLDLRIFTGLMRLLISALGLILDPSGDQPSHHQPISSR